MRVSPTKGQNASPAWRAILRHRISGARAVTFGAIAAYAVFLHATSLPTMPLHVVLPLTILEMILVAPYRWWHATGRALGALLAVTFAVDLILLPITLWVIPNFPVLLHLLYLLVITPATLASVPWGLVVTVVASVSHIALVLARYGPAVGTVDLVGPVVLFLLVGQQSVYYSRRVAQMAREAETESTIAAALLRVSHELATHATSAALLQHVASLVRELTDSHWACVMSRDPRRGTYRMGGLVSRTGTIDEEVRSVEFEPGDFPEILVARAGNGCVVVERDDPVIAATLRARWRLGKLVATALRRADTPVGLLLVGMDESELDAVTERLVIGVAAQAALALENARLLEDLRAASELKSEFVATMSHELRSPLNAILGYVEMLHEEDGEPGRATREGRCAILERVDIHARELLEMITATLDISRLEAGRLPVVLAPIDLTALLAQVKTEIPEYWHKPAVHLTWTTGELHPIETDAAKVKTLVRNLVHNALKFTDRGHVEVRIGLQPSAFADEDPRRARLEVAVSDTGIGIAPERQAVMFEMFRQGDASGSRRHGGVGLGLYIVQRLVQALEGTVRVESADGVGSTFTITLPVRIVAAPAQAAAWGGRAETALARTSRWQLG